MSFMKTKALKNYYLSLINKGQCLKKIQKFLVFKKNEKVENLKKINNNKENCIRYHKKIKESY